MVNYCANSLIVSAINLRQLRQFRLAFENNDFPFHSIRGERTFYEFYLDTDEEPLFKFKSPNIRYIHINFVSGNQPPEQKVKDISKQYPNLLFRLAYSCIESDYYGFLKVKNGIVQEDETWNIYNEIEETDSDEKSSIEDTQYIIGDEYFKFCEKWHLRGLGVARRR